MSNGHVCDCDYCGEISLCYDDGCGGKACAHCLDDSEDNVGSLPGEDMDGDFDSAMASAGFGTDEDYGVYEDYDGMDYDFGFDG